ncbi:MAG TPA: hypothetical protein PKV16_04575 [Caldisericia bacterium]|nr:hypothetical protein [Caldisericia bacterium]HPF48585.1 hypothetical protein [Caldisericia bacterium]HPI83755.1 hypothetical protein [Caldisericia bacterium]HPQ93040.1 hypothetical protein [Caldisericia bacterium]HRV75127.1 hypothetical protein [Caldisericia bacterium]
MSGDNQEIREYKTKTNGHRINQYYTLILFTALLLVILPEQYFDLQFGWAVPFGCVAVAAICTYVPRLFGKMCITRVYVSETFVQITAKVIQNEDITRIRLVNRPGLFGKEIQLFTSSIAPVAFAALDELQEPDKLIDDLRETLPGVPFVETYANYHFLDWGLVFMSIALVWMIVWRIFF